MATTVLVRAKLTTRDWQRIRKLAIDRHVPVSELAGDALRALLKEAVSVFSIHLWRDDRHDENYCGCWHVPVSEDDPAVATLREAGFGCFHNEDNTIGRGFFLVDELAEQMQAAERVTGCIAEAVTECIAEATVYKREAVTP